MRSSPNFDPKKSPVEDAVLEAVSSVVVADLRHAAEQTDGEDSGPLLIQVDGPGRTLFLDRLETTLDPVAAERKAGSTPSQGTTLAPLQNGKETKPEPWSAIRFDAWQYQRVAPPWWWLMSALDRQLRERSRHDGFWRWARNRTGDVAWRVGGALKDLVWVLPGLALLFVAWVLYEEDMLAIVQWVATFVGGIAAILAFGSSAVNVVRRHLLAESPRGAKALLRNTDPMADLLRRYAFLVRSAKTPIIVLIDNLDRCRADYVVEMLEGIQTLFKSAGAPRGNRHPVPPQMVFVVAADRAWLCESFMHVYEEFKETVHEPGRPFGLLFVDKMFDFVLRIPTVPPGLTEEFPWETDDDPVRPERRFEADTSELAVRKRLRAIESPGEPSTSRDEDAVHEPHPGARIGAVRRVAQIELDEPERHQCSDTARRLDELVRYLNPGPAVVRQLDTAYCVQRTTQLLAGHQLGRGVGDDGQDADARDITRLGLWTVLTVRWPNLAAHLAKFPDRVDHLRKGTVPDGLDDEELELVFPDPDVRRLAAGFSGIRLDATDIKRFTTPIAIDHAAKGDHAAAGQNGHDNLTLAARSADA